MVVHAANLEYRRAGSDYLGICWSANIVDDENTATFKRNEPVILQHGDNMQTVYPIKKEKMDGKVTWLVVDEDGAMMMAF